MGSSVSVSRPASRPTSHDVTSKPTSHDVSQPSVNMSKPKYETLDKEEKKSRRGVVDASPAELWREVYLQQKAEPKEDLIKRRSTTEWHTVRIFISSTFKDFHNERELLIKQIFEHLRVWCRDRRLRLLDVDLRWGIPKDHGDENTVRICLEEVDRCAKENVMPYILCLSSTRIGWIPKPEQVPAELIKKFDMVYGLSVTEMEIVRGAFNIIKPERKINPNALFMLRRDTFLKEMDDITKHEGFILRDEKEQEKEDQKMKELRKHIKQDYMTDQVIEYSIHNFRKDGYPKFDIEPDFSEKILEFFKRRISLQYPVDDNLPDDLFQKAVYNHEAFLRDRARCVKGRDEVVREMMTYLNKEKDGSPLLVVGGPGTGKSAVMALVAEKIITSKEKRRIFCHFVGAVPKSTELKDMLNRLLLELNVITETSLVSDLREAAQLVSNALSKSSTPPLILIVDAINQFDESTETQLVSWIPHKLAPQVRCILSMIPDTPHHKNLISRKPQPKKIEVMPLQTEDCKIIATETFKEYNKLLSEAEMEALLQKQSSRNPLWLSIACEELHVHGIFKNSAVLNAIKNFENGLEGLLGQVLDRFYKEAENEAGQLLVATMCLLEVSKAGLLEDELLVLLSDTENLLPPDQVQAKKHDGHAKEAGEQVKFKRLPPMKWATVQRSLNRFLRPFGNLAEGRLDFYHRSISKVVRSKYLHNTHKGDDTHNKTYMWWHQKLADFFFDSKIYCRKVEELPFHLIRLQDKKRLEKFLWDWEVFDELFDINLSSTLFSYWRECNDCDLKKMKQCYRDKLRVIENDTGESKEVFSERLIQISRLFSQAGDLDESLEMAMKALKLEEGILKKHACHTDRLINVYSLLGRIYNERAKRCSDVIDDIQLPHLKPSIEYTRKATNLLEKHPLLSKKLPDKHPQLPTQRRLQLKLGEQKLALSFVLSVFDQIKGHDAKTGLMRTADAECKKVIKEAEAIFKKLGDRGSLAETKMNEAVSHWREKERHKQPQLFDEAWSLCYQNFGEYCLLAARMQHNWAIVYRKMKDNESAYEHFKQSFLIKYHIFGPEHVQTKTAMKTLQMDLFKMFHDEDVVMSEAKAIKI